jgi:hypothetical protein
MASDGGRPDGLWKEILEGHGESVENLSVRLRLKDEEFNIHENKSSTYVGRSRRDD